MRLRHRASADIVLLIGGGLMQVPMARTIRAGGYLLCVADQNPSCVARALADMYYWCDIRRPAQLIAIARAVNDRQRPRRITIALTAGTDFTHQAALVNRALGITRSPLALPVAVAACSSDKSQMRARLQERRIAVPRFRTVATDAVATPAPPLPLVAKPIDNMGGRGVCLVSRADQLNAALAHARAYSPRRTVLLEQYVTDPEYSVEMLVRNYRPYDFVIAERQIVGAPFFIEMGHHLPAALPSAAVRAIRSQCCRTIRAMGIRHGVAKFDLFSCAQRVTIGEVACRLSGGFMSGWTTPQASDTDLTARYLQQHRSPHHLRLHPPRWATLLRCRRQSIEFSLLSLPGRIQTLDGIAAVRALAPITHLFIRHHVGDTVEFPTNNVQKCLHIIAVGTDRDELQEVAVRARLAIDIRLYPGYQDTLAFLFAARGQRFPMAYRLPAALVHRLNRYPRAVTPVRRGAGSIAAPFVAVLAATELYDWHRLRLDHAVAALCQQYNIRLAHADATLARPFWRALLKGGLQGARFYIDTLIHDVARLRAWVEKWDGNVDDG